MSTYLWKTEDKMADTCSVPADYRNSFETSGNGGSCGAIASGNTCSFENKRVKNNVLNHR